MLNFVIDVKVDMTAHCTKAPLTALAPCYTSPSTEYTVNSYIKGE